MTTGLTPRSARHVERVLRELRVAEADAARKRAVDEKILHFLYRCYDADGRLLYIGCTSDVERRIEGHRSAHRTFILGTNPKAPLSSVRLIQQMSWYEASGPIVGRRAALAAERAAIKAERPLLNVVHNRSAS